MTRVKWYGVLLVMVLGALGLVTEAQGPLTNAMTLMTRSDANGYLITAPSAYTAPDSPLTAFANLRLRTDANGYLITAVGTTTSVLGTFVPIGGTTNQFPALKRNTTTLEVRLADDSGYTTLNTGSHNLASSGASMGMAAAFLVFTAPSAPSSCGTSPAVTNSNGSVTWVVTGGTGGAATGCVITMPTAANGWNCWVTNITQTAAHRADRTTVQTASTTTSVTWEYQIVSTGAATAFTASDVFRGICMGY